MRHLVATDGSNEGDAAVRYAASHATALDGVRRTVTVLTPETELIDGEVVVESEERAIEHGRHTLQTARELAASVADHDEFDVETTLLTGRPAQAIVDHVDEWDGDAIYVGHRGLSEKREQVVGSVAKSIVDKASVPVTVVR